MGRRGFLRLLVALSAWLPSPMLLAALPGSRSAAPPALEPWLDTLLPGDGSPSASQLRLAPRVAARAFGNPQLSRLVELGCAWLDKQAQSRGAAGFNALDEDGRIAVATAAEQAPRRTLPRVFFAQTLDLAYQEYYSQPATWESLGFSGPPQPRGHPGHDRPPGARP